MNQGKQTTFVVNKKGVAPTVIRVHSIPGKDETLIMQQELLTRVETTIERDEALALASVLIEHYDFTERDLAQTRSGGVPPKKSDEVKVIVVYGPQGCGKTRNSEAIRRHFKAAIVIEADETSFGLMEFSMRSQLGNTVVLLTNREGKTLDRFREQLEFQGYQPSLHSFRDIMQDPARACDHNWQRRICPDIYQSDYLWCPLCGSTKEL